MTLLLKSIRLKGFKSFAEATDIHFAPGVNILVGPNGCGKSNIVEAVRWVLGDGARELRADKSEDVIFNGSDQSRALGMANVSLVLDNQGGRLPLDFSEVSLSRKLFRNGENEYSVNHSKVRLKEVRALLAGTGMGKQGYAIVGQGELEQVLNGQPFTRRLMLEEAAGIIKFRQERDDISRRLVVAEQDLLRLRDVLTEIGQQRDNMAEKYARARTYQDWKAEFEELEEKRLGAELSQEERQRAERQSRIQALTAELEQAGENLQELTRQMAGLEEDIAARTEQLAAAKEQTHVAQMAVRDQEAEEALLRERIDAYRVQMEQMESGQVKLAEQIDQLQQEVAGYEQQNTAKLTVLSTETTAAEQEEARLQAEDLWLRGREQDLSAAEKSGQERQQRAAELARVLREEEAAGLLLKEQARSAGQSLLDLAGQLAEAEARRAKDTADFKRYTDQYTAVQERAAAAETAYTALVTAVQEQEREQSALTGELQRVMAQLKALRDLEAGHALYSDGVKAVLTAQDSNHPALSGILGTIADLTQIPPGLELAFEVAVGRGLENIVIKSGREARAAITFLEQKKVGRATFLPLDTLKQRLVPEKIRREIAAQAGVQGLGTELLTYDPGIEAAVQYLFGNIVVVDDLNHGLALFKQIAYPLRIVTLNGALLNSSGAITGGFNRTKGGGILSKKTEKTMLSRQLEQLKISQEAALTQSAELKKQAETMNAAWQQEEKQQLNLAFTLKGIREKLAETAEHSEDLQRRQAELETLQRGQEQELARRADRMAQAQAEIDQLLNARNQEEEQATLARQEFYDRKRDYGIARERWHASQEQLQMKAAEIRQNTEHLQKYQQIAADYRQSYQGGAEHLRVYQQEIEANAAKLRELSAELATGRRATAANLSQQEQQIKARDELSGALSAGQAERLAQQQRIDQAERSLHQLELQKVRSEMAYTAKLQQWEATLHRAYEPGDTDLPEAELKRIRLRAAELKEALEQLGPVDLQALQEFQELETRFTYLSGQAEDLHQGKLSLSRILEQTEQEMATSFDRFFQEVNASFRQTFQAIFGGGEAALQLNAAEEALRAGVDIIVKLPGKKSQPLSFLSGGERALTCIAFLFALLHLRPAPFCFLDEIDAALDEHNLIRFNQYLNKISRQTQFIIISHRQSTIVNGDHILGVTMEQKGVSRCVSLNLAEAARLAQEEEGSA
jgi:chromosome segregation protein